MKVLLLPLIYVLPLAVFSQDLITLHDSTLIEAKIISITPKEVRYKEFSYPDGPTIVLQRQEVYKIRYPNGIERIIFRQKNEDGEDLPYVKETRAKAQTNVPSYQTRTPQERAAMYDAGKLEAQEFYKGSATKLGVGVATFMGGGIGGVFVGGISFLTQPDIDLHPVSNPQLRRDPDFRKGYEKTAHRKKKGKVASGFGIGMGTLVVLVALININ